MGHLGEEVIKWIVKKSVVNGTGVIWCSETVSIEERWSHLCSQDDSYWKTSVQIQRCKRLYEGGKLIFVSLRMNIGWNHERSQASKHNSVGWLLYRSRSLSAESGNQILRKAFTISSYHNGVRRQWRCVQCKHNNVINSPVFQLI